METIQCQDCKLEYKSKKDESKKCPSCSSPFWMLSKTEEKKSSPPGQSESNGQKPTEISDIDRLIAAQNRTTHAVRAFVRFLFIQLAGLTLTAIFWNISLASVDERKCMEYGDYCDGNPFFQLLAFSVLVGSVVWSSRVGWEELEKSNEETSSGTFKSFFTTSPTRPTEKI